MQSCDKIIKTISRITKIVLGMRKLSRESAEDPMEKVGQDLRSLMNKQGLTTTTG